MRHTIQKRISDGLRTYIPRLVRALWFLLYAAPISVLACWLIMWLPKYLDVFVDRTSFPHGQLIGILWVLLNTAIFLTNAFFVIILASLIVAAVWRFEELVVHSLLSAKAKNYLGLTTYTSPLKHWLPARSEKQR